MKKQFLLVVIIIFTGLCFSSLQDNGVKACDANSTACSSMKKKSELNKQADYVEDADASFNMFMNPFRQL